MEKESFNLLLSKTSLLIRKEMGVRGKIFPERRIVAALKVTCYRQEFEDLKFSTRMAERVLRIMLLETCEAIIKGLIDYMQVLLYCFNVYAHKYVSRKRLAINIIGVSLQNVSTLQ
jgi:hypothetical protein